MKKVLISAVAVFTAFIIGGANIYGASKITIKGPTLLNGDDHIIESSYRADNSEIYSNRNIEVTVNSSEISLKGYMVNSTVMVPMREIFESLGADVSYTPESKTIKSIKDNVEVILRLNSSEAIVNGLVKSMPEKAVSIDGHTYVPVRFVAEAFGAQVDWDSVAKSVSISTNNSEDVAAISSENENTQIYADEEGVVYLTDVYDINSFESNAGISTSSYGLNKGMTVNVIKWDGLPNYANSEGITFVPDKDYVAISYKIKGENLCSSGSYPIIYPSCSIMQGQKEASGTSLYTTSTSRVSENEEYVYVRLNSIDRSGKDPLISIALTGDGKYTLSEIKLYEK